MKKTRSLHAITLIVAAFLVSSCTWDDSLIDYNGGMHCSAAKDISNYPIQTGITFASPEHDLCKQEYECVLDGGTEKCAPCEALGLISCGENRVCVDLEKANLSDCNTCRGNYMNIDKSTRESSFTCETDISTDNKHCGKTDIVKGDPSLLKDCTLETNSFCLDGICKTCSDGLVLLDVKTDLGSEKICVDPKTDVRYCGATASYEGVACKDDQYCDKGQCKVCNVVEGRIGLCSPSKTHRVCMELSDNESCGVCGKTCNIGQECWENEGKFVCVPKSDIKNCGGIGNACLATAKNAKNARCVADLCQYDCKIGYADAQKDSKDARLLNGCETSVQTAENCGGIGVKCGVASNTTEACFINLVGEEAYVGCKCATGFVDTDKNPSNGCEADCEFPRTSCINPNVCDTVLGTEEACSACNTPCQVSDAEQSYIALKTCSSVDNSYDTLKCAASECTEGYYTENYRPDIEASKLCQTPCATTHSNCANSLTECATNLGSKNLNTCEACKTGFGNCDDNWENGCESKFASLHLKACGVCSEDYGNCDNNWANGCEANFIKDNLTACQVCSAGFGNCDGNWENGCEAQFASIHLDACQVCKTGFGNCDGNWENGCETELAVMNLEACKVCEKDYGNCDGDWNNGCEQNLSDVTQCGSCKTKADCTSGFTCALNICTRK